MPNKPRDFQLLRGLYQDVSRRTCITNILSNLNIKCGIKSHSQISLIIFIENAKETLLENGRCKRVGQNYDTIGRIRQRFHFQKTDLV